MDVIKLIFNIIFLNILGSEVWNGKSRRQKYMKLKVTLSQKLILLTTTLAIIRMALLIISLYLYFNNNQLLQLTMKSQVVELQQCISSDQDEPLPLAKNHQSAFNRQGCPSIKNMMYNIKYNFVHSDLLPISSYQRRAINLTQDSEPAYILGNAYQYSEIKKFTEKYQSIIWISYRSNSKRGISDAGWGCMIRVIQMVLAEVIKRNNPFASTSQIIELFKEGQNNIFSLSNICMEGQIKKRYTGSTEIMSIISSILKNQHKIELARSIGPTIKPTLNLRFETQIFYESLNLKTHAEIEKQYRFPRMEIISNRVYSCSQTLPSEYTNHLKHLMKTPYFCGLIGGVANEALYIVGFHEERAIILDPHYIQEESDQESQIQYFKKTPRGVPMNKLSPSISICFYLKNMEEYLHWASEVCYCQKIYQPFLAFKVQTSDANDFIEKYRKRSQDYEVL